MTFKMKGFPLRSAFKHSEAEGTHQDHHKDEVVEEKKPQSNLAEFDIEREIGVVTRQLNAMQKWMDEYNAKGGDVPYPHNKIHVQREIENMTNKLKQLQSGNLEGYQRFRP